MSATGNRTVREWLSSRFELARGGGDRNIRAMEGLRGFAVLLVFLVHFDTFVKPWLGGHPFLLVLSGGLHSLGATGVDLFFVLSGYLIYGALISRPRKFLPYLARRIARIYPAFIPVFLLYVGVSFLFPEYDKIPASASAAALYLIQNFLLLPGIFSIGPLITVAWSLSYEMLYYLVIPLLISGLRLRERTSVFRVVLFSVLAGGIAIYCALFGGHVRLTMFIAGILLHEAMRHPHLPAPASGWSALFLVGGLLGALIPLLSNAVYVLKVGLLFVAFFAVCLTCFRDPASRLATVFSWTPLRWLGNMSYSYYLLHGFTLNAAFRALALVWPPADQGAWLFWALLPVMFAITLVPTSLLFLAVERPFSLAAKHKS